MRMRITQPYFDGLASQKMLLPWCKACEKVHFYPRSACPHCWNEDDYDWREASGFGAIHTLTVVRNNPPPAFVGMLPFAVVVIELDEGVRILSNLVGDYESATIGDRVAVEFIERSGENLPVFRAVTGE